MKCFREFGATLGYIGVINPNDFSSKGCSLSCFSIVSTHFLEEKKGKEMNRTTSGYFLFAIFLLSILIASCDRVPDLPSFVGEDDNSAKMIATKDNTKDDAVQAVFTLDINSLKIEKYMELPGVKMMYGMGVSPDGEVCICDCMDYTAQRGYVRGFSPSTPDVKSYKVGVYPRMIIFPQEL